jgi:hypothetical protein
LFVFLIVLIVFDGEGCFAVGVQLFAGGLFSIVFILLRGFEILIRCGKRNLMIGFLLIVGIFSWVERLGYF